MKLTFSPASPYRPQGAHRRDRARADRQDRVRADTVAPGTANEEYQHITPLKKLPVLITNDGDVILDSYVIVEYLNEIAGGSLIPGYGRKRWQVKTDHSLINGMLESMLLCRYEDMVRPEEDALEGVVRRPLEPGLERHGALRGRDDVLSGPLDIAQIGLVCVLGYADFRFADCGWRKAYPKLDKFHQKMLERPSVKISVPPAA